MIGGCDTVELAADYGTPLYLFDEFSLRSTCRAFKDAIGQRYADTSFVDSSTYLLNGALAVLIRAAGLGLACPGSSRANSGERAIASPGAITTLRP